MLKTILSISGKPGLFQFVSQGKNMLIVESIGDKKRVPVHSSEKVISLSDISMYTTDEDAPLRDVLEAIKEKEQGAPVSLDVKKATAAELRAYFVQVLPTFDQERVYVTDIKKLIVWYNLLISNDITDFKLKETENTQPTEEEQEAELKPEVTAKESKAAKSAKTK